LQCTSYILCRVYKSCPSKAMSEFTVHRLRFGNWLPSAIKSIAVDRKYSNKVAVGREDGEIEVSCLTAVYLVTQRVSNAFFTRFSLPIMDLRLFPKFQV
jgi:hypothetical protein